MLVVSDTSPVRALYHLGLLNLLSDLFGDVLVPPAVAAELERPKSQLPPIPLRQFTFIRVQAPTSSAAGRPTQAGLHPGESEAIALALEVRADVLLIDERAGRAAAAKARIAIIGVLGVLREAKLRGLIPGGAPAAGPSPHRAQILHRRRSVPATVSRHR